MKCSMKDEVKNVLQTQLRLPWSFQIPLQRKHRIVTVTTTVCHVSPLVGKIPSDWQDYSYVIVLSSGNSILRSKSLNCNTVVLFNKVVLIGHKFIFSKTMVLLDIVF